MSDNLHLKKEFGQNFIQDPEVVDDIINALDPDSDCFVIEIGPGGGAITFPLSERVGHLTAIEVDPRMVVRLRDELADNPNVDIIAYDILQADIKKILEEEHAENYKRLKIVGNIPYNITTPIITAVLESGIKFENFTIMIQKEVADRICSPPGKKIYSFMSVLVQYYTEPEYIRTVSKEVFMPVPKVDSAVVNMKFREKPLVDCDKDKLFTVVKLSFAHKRKTLANNLIGYAGATNKEVSELLESLGIDPRRRAETLSVEEFAKIANAVTKS